MEETIYIIKPEVFHIREEIRNKIENNGFNIVSRMELRLSRDFLRDFYSKEDEPLKSGIIHYMLDGPVEIGSIRGENVIERFIKLAGYYHDPNLCADKTIRKEYGNKNLVNYSGAGIFRNALHRTHPRDYPQEVDLYWNKIIFPVLIKDAKKIVNENADCKERLSQHIYPVIENALTLAKEKKVDIQSIEIAALFHDFTRMQGDRKKHHITSSKFAESFLKDYNFPEERIKLIKDMIRCHRGSRMTKKRTLESEILASADAMAHIQFPMPLFFTAYSKKGLSIKDGQKWVREKLERSFQKINLDEAKKAVIDKYDQLMGILRD